VKSLKPVDTVSLAFEHATLRIAIAEILPLREVPANVRKSVKYGQIAASIKEVGIIEPPVVVRDRDDRGRSSPPKTRRSRTIVA